jgi:hypothetical protein
MQAGNTFVFSQVDIHLWMVISDPRKDPANVLIVNFTTLQPIHESCCLVNAGEHPFVHHQTCVNYAASKVTTDQKLELARARGLLTMHQDLSPQLLQRIRESAMESQRLKLDHAQILANQGLVEI